MKLWKCMLGLVLFLALAAGAAATTYYVDDNSNDGDVYTPDYTGNDSNDGLSPSSPKLTINNLLASTNLMPGDIVLIDTGTYTENVLIGSGVVGADGNRITFQGSTNLAAGGATFTGSGTIIEVRGTYLHLRDIRSTGGNYAFSLSGAQFCEFERIYASGSTFGIHLTGASNSNAFRACTILSLTAGALRPFSPATGNYVEHCVAYSRNSAALTLIESSVSNVVNSVGMGYWGISTTAGQQYLSASHNIFFSTSSQLSPQFETLADFQGYYTNAFANTVADPKFVNAEGMDFHLLSAAGFVSNGVWVTNAAVGFSPGIDFGPRE